MKQYGELAGDNATQKKATRGGYGLYYTWKTTYRRKATEKEIKPSGGSSGSR
jgi:hypothetical protein